MNKKLEQFFTNSHVSDLIASSLSGNRPKIVVDVGVGEGALLKAIKHRWKKARLLGIDIDPSLGKKDTNNEIERIMANGLDHTLPTFLNKVYGKIDLAVSNPPYTAIQGNKHTELILKEAGLFGAIGKSKNYPAELVFLAQNLRILQKNGRLAIIVPSGIINNDRWARLRSLLGQSNKLEAVIELPDNSFKQTEAKTFVLILRKGGCTDSLKLYKVGNQGKLSRHKTISVEEANHRMDWSFYECVNVSMRSSQPRFTLRELGARIFRGQLSMAAAKEKKVQIFHSSDMNDDPQEIILCQSSVKEDNPHLIIPGDILISRVGSRCLGRRCYVKKGVSIVSDSVFVIRLEEKYRSYAWKYLSSDAALENIKNLSRGVCAKYITKDQLLDLPLY